MPATPPRTRSLATIEAHIERIDANIESARKKEALVQKAIAELQEERAKYEAEAATKAVSNNDGRLKGAHFRHHVDADNTLKTCQYCIEDGLI